MDFEQLTPEECSDTSDLEFWVPTCRSLIAVQEADAKRGKTNIDAILFLRRERKKVAALEKEISELKKG